MGKIKAKIKAEKLWMNGKLIDWHDPKAYTHVISYTLHYGIGVFEGLRAYETHDGNSIIFRLEDHIKRFFESAKMEDLNIPFFKSDICNACIEVVKANKLTSGYIRPLSFIGESKMGLGHNKNDTKTTIMAWPWDSYLGDEGLKNGIRLKTSSWTKCRNMAMTKSKSVSNYGLSNRTKMEAIKAGYDEALLLDDNGLVAEASAENIFFVKDGKIITPPPSAPILIGITRNSIIDIATWEEYEIIERNFTREELYTADEVFLTGTAAELAPVREIDTQIIGNGKPGPTTLNLQKKFFNILRGKNGFYKDWLTHIY